MSLEQGAVAAANDQYAAHMKGVGQMLAGFYDDLRASAFSDEQAFILTRDWFATMIEPEEVEDDD